MVLTHSGVTYECAVAVKCDNDKYIILYSAEGETIATFREISDFSEFTLSGGSFTAPCDCAKPIPLSAYSIGSRIIATDDWELGDDGRYSYAIESKLISANSATCNILLFFAEGTSLNYTATQEAGKIVLYTASAPASEIVIDSIQIMRA